MRIQLWSYNYDPEPSGIAPLSSAWARAMTARGHDVLVVAAHPHYPTPVWGQAIRLNRERRDGVRVLRLPLWIGRRTGLERIRQEVSFCAALSAVAPLLPRADVIVAVSPSFPALMPAMAAARTRSIPWVLWLQDILPDGAATTGLLPEGRLVFAARRFERAAYADASKVVVISEAFRRNLLSKGVAAAHIERIYNPSPHSVPDTPLRRPTPAPRRLLVMGNIGQSQGLEAVVRTLEENGFLGDTGSELRIAGDGVAAQAVRSAITTNRVTMTGVLFGEDMEAELETATLGLVTQQAGQTEFNLPSKLMNYLAHGVPVLAIVARESETARLVQESGAGWVAPNTDDQAIFSTLREALSDSSELARRSRAGHLFAKRFFDPDRIAEHYEAMLSAVIAERSKRTAASAR